MVVVTIRLVSANGPGRDRHLGDVFIENVGGDEERGDYSVRLTTFGGRRTWRSGSVRGFPRRMGGFDLLFRALGATVGDRNPDVVGRTAAVRGEVVDAMRGLLEAVEGSAAARDPGVAEACGRARSWLARHAPGGPDRAGRGPGDRSGG